MNFHKIISILFFYLLFLSNSFAQKSTSSTYYITGKIVDSYKLKPLNKVKLTLYKIVELDDGTFVREWVEVDQKEVFRKKKGEFLLPLNTNEAYEVYFSLQDYGADINKLKFEKRNIAPGERIFIQVKMIKGNGYYLEANLHDAKNDKNIVDAIVTIVDDGTKERISIYKHEQDPILLPLEAGHRYHIEAQAEGYLSNQSEPFGVALGGYSVATIDLALRKFDPTKSWKLKSTFFNVNEAQLNLDNTKELDQLIKILEEFPEHDLEISCHTDSRGEDDYNLTLSQHRAEAIAMYLKDKGIDSNRLLPLGYGENKLLNNCKNGVRCSQMKHEENRRIELKLLSNEGL